jgi:hypothetical protein
MMFILTTRELNCSSSLSVVDEKKIEIETQKFITRKKFMAQEQHKQQRVKLATAARQHYPMIS